MSTLKQLRLEARLSVSQLARLANLDRQTVERAENGEPVRDVKAYAIVDALNKALGKSIRLEQVDDLQVL